MAAAVCRLYDGVKLDIGPATDDGFYYDFDLPVRIAPEDFPKIEAEMARIVGQNAPFERVVMSRGEAEKTLSGAGQTYKLDRLSDIPAGEEISFYRCGDFADMCRGPHVASTGDIRAFKLVSVAGSYFRGRETNPMLQRIYGIVAATQKELDAHLERIEEARRRDHRKLGKELDLFSIHESVGPGLVHWHPKAARMRVLVEDFWRREHFRSGYELLFTPHIGRANLWQTSGHLDFYRDSMYSSMDIDGDDYFIKPMNCPFHIQVYQTQKRSYRELPLRWAELGTVYRYEKSGVLHGLLRVRGFTQDDAHIICTPEQIFDEIKSVLAFCLRMFRAFGFSEFRAYLATRPAKAVGEESRWDEASRSLEAALKSEQVEYEVDPGGGAFYGPKIDIKVRDVLGREWQMSTIQFDFNVPERFGLVYVGEDGREHRPYMVHRALLGSLERFFGILIEHYGGAFPLWLAPEQVRVLPVTEKQLDYALKVESALRGRDIRATTDKRSEKLGAKIRSAQLDKVPFMAIVGQKEEASGAVSVRGRSEGDMGARPVDAFAEMLVAGSVPGAAESGNRPT
ncbi:MAG: threonine--tRNA ligase [Lentisphaerae bacterium]|nr:threonine--tRNA ligase [Lentisphaerota bacterium]